MDYHKSIKYLEKFWKFGIKLGLERINHLLELLDHPETEFRAIHIGGTNGKGSVAAILSSILFKAGYKVGLYTSPHLIDYTERIKINNQDIDSNTFARYLTKIRKIIGEKWTLKELPTEFEILTALAFLIFAEKRIEIAVIEVGLGGRLDATNVVEPLVSVITNVDYDHTEILSKDLKKIAYEKAGIVKRGVPLVTA